MKILSSIWRKEFPWHQANVLAQKFALAYREKFGDISPVQYDMNWFLEKYESTGGSTRRAINSIDTIGGGNHFIETGISNDGDYWITIHTGSRNFGKRICEYWQNKAEKFHKCDRQSIIQEQIKVLKETVQDGKELYTKIKALKAVAKPNIDMKGCEWLEGEDAAGYLFDMIFSQIYAEVNRKYIVSIICDILKVTPVDQIDTVHNFIDFHDFIIRKGAIRSYIGERMIIPFNMRDGILVCEGKSNPEWNFSAPHGAGRVLSRGEAKRKLSVETFKSQMEGIYSTSVGQATLDESPGAYKDSTFIEQAIEPTAKILNKIKPIHNMKASEEDE
jgi:RNA-splicing ligase RtcB